jgi:hypothetical protein
MKHQETVCHGIKSISCGLVLLLATAGLLLTGCNKAAVPPQKQESAPSADSDHVGIYKLLSISGSQLPCKPPHEGGAPEVQSGSIVLNADGTLSSTTTFKIPSGQIMNREVPGTYTREGAKFTMHWKGAGVTTGTLDGSTFTMVNEGMPLVYSK